MSYIKPRGIKFVSQSTKMQMELLETKIYFYQIEKSIPFWNKVV